MHKFTIRSIDIDCFCAMAIKAIPQINFGVVKGYEQFDVVFSGTKAEAKQLKNLIEEKVCLIDNVSYSKELA